MSDVHLPVCRTCGTQYDLRDGKPPTNCKICDDPRQYVPGTGQAWTTLADVRETHRNTWTQDTVDSRVWFGQTEPKFAIGQRCCLLQTPHGNILWDIIALIDDETVDFINSKGTLKAIVVSHPHYYTTYAAWSSAFKCPIYTSAADAEWLCCSPSDAYSHVFMEGDDLANTSGGKIKTKEILPGVTAIRAGGHFDGSLLLHWENKLFIADTIVTVPSAYKPHPRPPGQTTYAFLWSIPNMIPLPPAAIHGLWRAVQPFMFDTTHGAFEGMDIRDSELKGRMLESMKICVRTGGTAVHGILEEVNE